MAESTTPTTPTSTTSTSSTTSKDAPVESKQFIKASTDDNALEPDALRGSPHVVKDAKVTDDEETRREVYKKEETK